ncbi:MAG: hypothetical protein HYZ54_05580 [Ignavibacteriae bacterium]|nr:hypothetical protein [Ignavibacteriota bacterium]
MNKILPLVTTLLLLNLSRAYSHDDNASSLKLLIGKYKTSLDSVETVYKETMKELDTKKTRFSADNETTSLDLSSKIKFLEGKISSIEQERKLDIEANEAEVQKAKGILNTRYKAGLEAIICRHFIFLFNFNLFIFHN